ncbi:MAG: DNA repair protein RecN [Pseudomonadota bacterium]
MLIQLSIRNIILIESCDIALKSGLCVLSGETGAGKSILLDSLGLVLGARADSSLIRGGEAQGAVSAEFDITRNIAAKNILAELDLEPADTLIIRRSLTSDGKTRALINDQSVTASALKRIGETLVELHGQHDQKTLQDAVLHRAMLTDYAKLTDAQKTVAEHYHKWNESKNAIAELLKEVELATREQEYLRHMRGELKVLNPQFGEEDTLTTARAGMMQSEKMFEVLNEAIGELNSGKGVLSALRNSQRTLTRSALTATAEVFAPIIEGLEKASIEAEEALYALEKIGQEAQFDPRKLEEMEERLFALKAAGRKYNLPVDELAVLRDEVDEKLAIIDSQEHKLKAMKMAESEAKSEFLNHAKKLSEQRRKAAIKLESAIEKELTPLKMEGTRFRVRIDNLEETNWGAHGIDYVQFECATNVSKGAKDITYSSLGKIASGGELSRFMLAMKVALSSVGSVSTIIFDEIDTGTGGAVADAIGKRLAELGKNSQVLVVTHLPQVAARGSQHLLIQKQQKNKKIVTNVTELSGEERQEELARMLAGETITTEARKAAQKLLEQAA